MGTADAAASPPARSWPFYAAVVGWLAVGVGGVYLTADFGGPAQVILAGLWLVGLGLLLRQFLSSLFGPVLLYDAIRAGRRPRLIIFRVIYALLLAFLLTWIYFAWLSMARYRGEIEPKDMAELAETYFGIYMVVQFIMICVLTPAAVAGSLAEEKERRTLEFILATDLRDREILFGKLASRVGGLILFLMAGLPILTLMQFFGGIDPDLVIAGFAASVMVVLSLSAVAMAASVSARKARDAIALTYLIGVAYLLFSFFLFLLSGYPGLQWDFDLLGYTITSQDVGYLAVVGNPILMVDEVMRTRGGGGMNLFTALGHFALFHAMVVVALLAWSGLRLRAIALRQMFGGSSGSILRRLLPGKKKGTTAHGVRRRSTRPDVGDSPILWKEVFVDAGVKLGVFGRIVVSGIVAMSLVPVGFIFWYSIVDPGSWRNTGSWWSADRWHNFGEGMNAYLRGAGSVAATIVFLAVAVRGAGSVSGERDRHSLDVLLTTPLSARTIVWGKWWGCILGMRWAWAWILGLWVLTMAAGGVHPLMFPAAVVSLAVYASGFAWIGLFCSLHTRTTLRATMAAIVASVGLGGGYFLVFVMCCLMPLSFARSSERDAIELMIDFLCGFSPSVNMGWLPIHEFDDRELRLGSREIPYVPFWMIGLVAWAGLSFLLSRACVAKFRRMANRVAIAPERLPRPPGPPPLPGRRTENGSASGAA